MIGTAAPTNDSQANKNAKPQVRKAEYQPWHYELAGVIGQYKKTQSLSRGREILSRLHFSSDSRELLNKYQNFPPSIELNIYENHFRFGNQEGVISRDDPSAIDFLKHVAREEIPAEMVEILHDGGIKLYDGCVIVKITDHRVANVVGEAISIDDIKEGSSEEKEKPTVEQPEEKKREPKTYRAVLKPTSISMYHDLLYLSDRLPKSNLDDLLLEMESKYLPIIRPKLDLTIPLNPFDKSCPSHIKVDVITPTIYEDETTGEVRIRFLHRDDDELGEIDRKDTHENVHATHGSEYEDFMMLLANKDILNGSSNNNMNKFSRLRFVEQFKKRADRNKQQQQPAAAATAAPASGKTVPNASILDATNATPNPSDINNSLLLRRRQQQAQSKQKPSQVQSPLTSTMKNPKKTGGTNGQNVLSLPHRQAPIGTPNSPYTGLNSNPGSAVKSNFSSGQISGHSSAAGSPNASAAQPRRRAYATKKKKEDAARQGQNLGGSPNLTAGGSPGGQQSRINTPVDSSFNNFSPKMVGNNQLSGKANGQGDLTKNQIHMLNQQKQADASEMLARNNMINTLNFNGNRSMQDMNADLSNNNAQNLIRMMNNNANNANNPKLQAMVNQQLRQQLLNNLANGQQNGNPLNINMNNLSPQQIRQLQQLRAKQFKNDNEKKDNNSADNDTLDMMESGLPDLGNGAGMNLNLMNSGLNSQQLHQLSNQLNMSQLGAMNGMNSAINFDGLNDLNMGKHNGL